MRPHVRVWHLADMYGCARDVRFARARNRCTKARAFRATGRPYERAGVGGRASDCGESGGPDAERVVLGSSPSALGSLTALAAASRIGIAALGSITSVNSAGTSRVRCASSYRYVRPLPPSGVHWDNAHQNNINDNGTYPKLSAGKITPRAGAQKRVIR